MIRISNANRGTGTASGRLTTDLATRAHRCHVAGDTEGYRRACEPLWDAIRPLVVRIASYRFKLDHKDGVDTNDLIQAGWDGVAHAVRKFDPARGCQFCSYAVPWIFQAMSRTRRDARYGMGVPRDVQDILRKFLLDGERADPDPDPRLECARRAAAGIRFGVIRPRDKHTFPVFDPRPARQINAIDLGDEVASLLTGLTPEERDVVVQGYGLDGDPPRTHAQIGARLGCSRQRVQFVHGTALARLRHAARVAGVA